MTRAEFHDLIRKLNRKLYLYAFRILNDRDSAEDAVQEVFIKLWKMNTQLEEFNSIEALATTITKNQCIDHLRKKKYIDFNNPENFTFCESRNLSPYEQLEISDTLSVIRKIIGTLPEKYRELLRLRDIEEFSYEEIAEITGLNINAIRVNLSRARKMLREEFLRHTHEYRGNKRST